MKTKKIKDCTIDEIFENRYDERIQPLVWVVQSYIYLNFHTPYFKDFSMNDFFEKWVKPCIKDEILEMEIQI